MWEECGRVFYSADAVRGDWSEVWVADSCYGDGGSWVAGEVEDVRWLLGCSGDDVRVVIVFGCS